MAIVWRWLETLPQRLTVEEVQLPNKDILRRRHQ